MYAKRRNFRDIMEIWVEEHDGDVSFFTGSGNLAVSRMRNEKYAIQPLFMAKSPKLSCHIENWDRETRWWRQIFHREWKYGGFAHAQCIRPLLEQFVHFDRYHVPQNAFLVPSMFSLLVWEKAIYDGTRRLSHFAQSSLHSTDTGYNFQFQPQSARTTHSCVPEWKPFMKQNMCIFVVLKGCFFHRRSHGVQRGEVHPQCKK